jgi:Holliday junction resolvase
MSERHLSYYKGKCFEDKVKNILERMGYAVLRSARSAFPDLIAVRDGKPILIECKVNRYLSWEDKLKLLNLASSLDAGCAVAYSKKGQVRIQILNK